MWNQHARIFTQHHIDQQGKWLFIFYQAHWDMLLQEALDSFCSHQGSQNSNTPVQLIGPFITDNREAQAMVTTNKGGSW